MFDFRLMFDFVLLLPTNRVSFYGLVDKVSRMFDSIMMFDFRLVFDFVLLLYANQVSLSVKTPSVPRHLRRGVDSAKPTN